MQETKSISKNKTTQTDWTWVPSSAKPIEPSEPQNPDFQIASASGTESKVTDEHVYLLVDEGEDNTIPDLGDDDEDDDIYAEMVTRGTTIYPIIHWST